MYTQDTAGNIFTSVFAKTIRTGTETEASTASADLGLGPE